MSDDLPVPGFCIDDVYEPDEELARDGVWFPVLGGKMLVRVRPAGNLDYARYKEARLRPYKRLADKGRLDPEISLDIDADAAARHIVVDWRGAKDKKGKEVGYTPDRCKQLLLSNRYFLDDVVTAANDEESYRRAEAEGAAEALGKD